MLISLAFLFLFPFAGTVSIPFSSLFEDSVKSKIFWDIRVPRVLGAFITGSILALAGMAFQSLFRNDLATPYTLGISSGSALGAVIAIKFITLSGTFHYSVIQVFSFTTALLTVIFLHLLTFKKRAESTYLLLLAGIAVNFTCTGAILFIQYIASGSESSRMVRWMMGSIDFIGYGSVFKLIPPLFFLLALLFYFHRDLDLISIDTEIAVSRGVNLAITEKAVFFVVSLAVAVTVANTGPIGFVGMIAPHIARKLIGREHRYLIPSSMMSGGILLLFSDTVARTIIPPSEIPVGVITAMSGGPFFIFILMRKGKNG